MIINLQETAATVRAYMTSEGVPTLLAEPRALWRDALKTILQAACFRPVHSIERIDPGFLEGLHASRPGLLVIGPGYDPVSLGRQIALFKEIQEDGKVVVVGHRYGDAVAALSAGGNAYFDETTTFESFEKSLHLVMAGHTILSLSILSALRNGDQAQAEVEHARAERKIDCAHIARLSRREEIVLQLLTEGASNKAIASKAAIAEQTVRVHVKAILRKIGARNRTQAAIWAVRRMQGVQGRTT